MGASLVITDEIKTCTKHDLKPGSNDRAKTVFQLLRVVNILALLIFVKKYDSWIHVPHNPEDEDVWDEF